MTSRAFSGETLRGGLARGSFPEIRRLMLEFVGEYLRDFEQAAERAGLTLAQARVLGLAAMEPSSMRALAARFGCDPSNLTAKVDRLIALGLAERLADPADGRVTLVAATAKGVKLSGDLCDSREWLARVLDNLGPAEVDTVQSALAHLMRSSQTPD